MVQTARQHRSLLPNDVSSGWWSWNFGEWNVFIEYTQRKRGPLDICRHSNLTSIVVDHMVSLIAIIIPYVDGHFQQDNAQLKVIKLDCYVGWNWILRWARLDLLLGQIGLWRVTTRHNPIWPIIQLPLWQHRNAKIPILFVEKNAKIPILFDDRHVAVLEESTQQFSFFHFY